MKMQFSYELIDFLIKDSREKGLDYVEIPVDAVYFYGGVMTVEGRYENRKT